MKAEFNKLDIKKLLNVPNGMKILKANEDDLDGDKLKTISVDLKTFPVDLEKFSNVVSKDVLKKTVFHKVQTIFVNSDKSIQHREIKFGKNYLIH